MRVRQALTLRQRSFTESVQSIIRRDEEDRAVPPVVEETEARMTPGIREGLASLDTVDMFHLFSMRAVVMKSPPKFFRGVYRSA